MGRNTQTGLLRLALKTPAAGQRGRPRLHQANDGIAVFDRERERAAHEWRAHTVEFAVRYPAGKDERLGASAQRPVQGANPHRALRVSAQRVLADLRAPRPYIPKGSSHLPYSDAIHNSPIWTGKACHRNIWMMAKGFCQ